jgi:1-aminocyclopropane-1-carboxylate synthase
VPIYECALQDALSRNVTIKAILICNPHNPLGQRYSKETLEGLIGLCMKYDIHFISDEIYALSQFDVDGRKAEPVTSALSIESRKPELVHVLYGMSKV